MHDPSHPVALDEETSSLEGLASSIGQHFPGRRGELLASFVDLLYRRAEPGYFKCFTAEQLREGIVSMFEFLEEGRGDNFHIRVHNPEWLVTRDGEARTAIEVTGPDQAFLVDSLRELMRVRGYQTIELFHPILAVEREDSGAVRSLLPPTPGKALTSFQHLELGRLGPGNLVSVEAEARQVFAEVRRVALDFEPMVEKLREVIARLRGEVPRATLEDPEEIAEAVALLEWLLRSNYVFLGFREYDVRQGPEGPRVAVARGSGLGILSDESKSSFFEPRLLKDLPEDFRRRVVDPRILTVHKTNAESRAVRRTRMDYVGIKKLDAEGRVAGELRFLGLFTTRALGELPADVPILRRKLSKILERANVVSGSHDHKEIFSIFCSLPKTELFVNDIDTLEQLIFTELETRDRLDVRIHYRPDPLERGVSAMVLIPRDHFSVENRRQIQKLLTSEFNGTVTDYRLALSDEPLARLHFYLEVPPGTTSTPAVSYLEEKVAEIIRPWDERVREALEKKYGVEEGARLAQNYAGAFPAAYSAQEPPSTAVSDIRVIESAQGDGRPRVTIRRGRTRRKSEVSFLKIFGPGEKYFLSRLMPILTHLGLEVWDELSFRVEGPRCGQSYIHSFRVLGPGGEALPTGSVSRKLEDTILRVLAGDVLNDWLNSLVVLAELSWRQVEVLRAYTAYFRQLEGSLRQRTAYTALRGHPAAARALVELFEARFYPASQVAERASRQAEARAELERALEEVPGILEDQILRGYENLILATVRTNYFHGNRKSSPPALALKVRCCDVAGMPPPRPVFEIFVANAHMEGVHLRSGSVARGGIRWSDRVDDFRTEILGLMKAQRTKNALIVPVGAKGGFVLKQPPPPERLSEEIRRQYEIFVGSLLDLTDNVVAGRVRHPPRTVIHDEADPYLVVAADRGTAQFSDLANQVAAARSFWLGDAFASGGATGYSHKDKGITARGAWECVKRHFLETGVDIQSQPVSVVGIGDMSGDVFGNGMLLSSRIRLLAAFNQEHIFLDPAPDPELSHQERRRLFELERSSWTDYDPEHLSSGGGVFERHAKSIPLSPEARELLGTEKVAVNGDELTRLILTLPVDLIWNGGIGTYIKATAESHREVSDPENDIVRVDAQALRAKVIGEGGNLGVTQRGRIELALRGVRLNTDFIDNSGGVDLSDREVNLKILLEEALRRGSISRAERNGLLEELGGEVCDQVIADNSRQSAVLSVEERCSAALLDQFGFVISELEERGLLDRGLESIPDEREIRELRDSGMGLVRPQLAVVLAYVKIDAFVRVLKSSFSDGPGLEPFVYSYFPSRVASRFAAEIADHPLRREIATTAAVNECVNRMGVIFLHRLSRERGVDIDRALHAYLIAAGLVASDDFHAGLDGLQGAKVPAGEIYAAFTSHSAAVEKLARWCLRRGKTNHAVAEVLAVSRQKLSPLVERHDPKTARLLETARELFPDLPRSVLEGLVWAERSLDALEVAEVMEVSGAPVDLAERALVAAGDRLRTGQLVQETARIVKALANDWQMCSALMEDLEDLRGNLACRILAAVKREALRPAGDLRECIDAVAARLVPDRHPAYRRVKAALARVRGREPLTPSGLFVLFEELRRLVGDS